MIASRVGVIVACAIAVLLGVVVAIDLRRDTAPPSTSLVAGFDPAAVTRLAWSRSGEPELVIERIAAPAGSDGSARWQWVKPYRGIPAEPGAVDAAIAALRGGRWHRRAAIGQAGMQRVALAVTSGTRTTTIGIGAPLEGAGQTWLAIGDHAYLVDDWIARALAPEPLALRETRPLRDVDSAHKIVVDRLMPKVTGFRIEGFPRRMVRPLELLLAPDAVDPLQRALAGMTIVEGTDRGQTVGMTISIDGPPVVTVEVYTEGCKENEVAIGGTYGHGCITAAAYQAIADAIDRLTRPTAELVERRLVPFDPLAITLPDGIILDLAKRPKVGERDADPTRVAELLAMLATPIPEVVDSPPTVTPIGTLTAIDRAGAKIELELLPGNRIRRKGEPVALEPGTGAYAIIARPSAELADTLLWTEEPTTIHAITIDATTYTRGVALGEWTRRGPGRDDPAAVTALAQALANVRGKPIAKPPKPPLHTVAFEVKPPGGTVTSRTLKVGAGCEATVDGKHVALDKPLCDAVAALTR